MQPKNLTTTILLIVTVAASTMAFITVTNRPSDNQAIAEYKAIENRIPKMQYPKKDIRGRDIPEFDFLMVMPDCKSCSDFRKKSQTFMDSKPDKKFFVATPDLSHIERMLNQDNCYVYIFDQKSKLAEIAPGVYSR